MIEVCFIEFFANDRRPNDILKKKMCPLVCISSTEQNASLSVKVVYIVSSTNNDYDQVLCSETVEGIPAGIVEFDLETDIPDMSKIPREHLIGLTSILFLFYTEDGKEFVRVGYFVKIDYPGIRVLENPSATGEEEAPFDINDTEYSAETDKIDQKEGIDQNQIDQQEEIEESIEEEGANDEEEGANDEEIKTEGVHDGILFVTEDSFKEMDLDLSKLEGTILDPPLVTVFTEVWPESEEPENEIKEEIKEDA